ncbi:hypothetical protein CRG98_041356 [Punica granatum]|uniref:Uncharacterized protein n=1 Tax=Punica granatum TaxID=22663 RepID=A0A2I0I2U0_PUNGR|nr:hypothetical protein CRG98_041356 [Punica granatum]
MDTRDKGVATCLFTTRRSRADCAHPNLNLVGACMRAPMHRGLGVSTFPGMHVRRSRHLPFYDPELEGQ